MKVPRDTTEINRARRACGFRELKPGISKCLRCGKDIKTNDVIGDRICSVCKYKNKHTHSLTPANVPKGEVGGI